MYSWKNISSDTGYFKEATNNQACAWDRRKSLELHERWEANQYHTWNKNNWKAIILKEWTRGKKKNLSLGRNTSGILNWFWFLFEWRGKHLYSPQGCGWNLNYSLFQKYTWKKFRFTLSALAVTHGLGKYMDQGLDKKN